MYVNQSIKNSKTSHGQSSLHHTWNRTMKHVVVLTHLLLSKPSFFFMAKYSHIPTYVRHSNNNFLSCYLVDNTVIIIPTYVRHSNNNFFSCYLVDNTVIYLPMQVIPTITSLVVILSTIQSYTYLCKSFQQ